jgi:hypothetical protein
MRKVALILFLVVSLSLSIIPLSVSGQETSDAASLDSASYSSGSGYKMTVRYSISGVDLPTAPPQITYIAQSDGQSKTIDLTKNFVTLTMAKNTAWSVKAPPIQGSKETEQWYSTQTLSGTTPKSGSTSKTFTFQHQYKLTVTSPYDTPTGTGWYNSGATAYAQLLRTTVPGPTGTRYVFDKWSGDASGTYQKSNSILMDAPKTATAVWKTQYLVSFAVNPDSGSTTPSGSNYYDSGLNKQIKIKATPSGSGNAFVAWTQTGSITIKDPHLSDTYAIINGPGTITANFAIATQNPTHLTIQCQPSQTDLNNKVTLTGQLTGSKGGLNGKTVFLTYTTAENSLGWTSIGQATTGPDGKYSLQWTEDLPPVGAYFVMAQFPGDSSYKCSSAVASNNGTSLTVVPEYALGALAALGACFAGFAIIKKRSALHL